jgi:ubiquinone biosynthesis protein
MMGTAVQTEERPNMDQSEQNIERLRSKITKRQRLRKIITTVSKHGIMHLLADRSRDDVKKQRLLGERLRKAFEELGPTFIKLGQVIMTRQELLPEAVTTELAKLLDDVTPMPFEYMAVYLERELPDGLQTFKWIDTDPIGSASLAQVYKAELQDGRTVAVKVVRPVVDKLFQVDISVIKRLVRRVEKLLPDNLAAGLDLSGLISDYYSSSVEELDMRTERRSMDEHRVFMDEFETIDVPEVYFASEHVLVMQYIDGWNLKEFPVDFLTFEERLERMVDLAHYYIKTFVQGYYHADPHGSNIMIDRSSKKAYIIDWGMVGRMDAIHTEAIFRMLLHTRVNQAEDAAEAALDLFQPTKFTDRVNLKDQLRSLFIHYVTSNQASKYNWGNLILSLILIGMKNYCRVPTGLALWAKGFSAAEGTARWLCPEISYHTVVETADVQLLRQWFQRRFNYRASASLLAESTKLVTSLPRRLNMILEHLAWNDMTFTVENRVSPSTLKSFQKMVNRLVMAGIVIALLVAGSLLMSVALRTPNGGAVEAMSSAMLWSGVILGAFTLWSVFRSRRT